MESTKKLSVIARTGTIIMSLSSTPPPGYLPLAGQLLKRSDYTELYNSLPSNVRSFILSTYFLVPDLRGKFVRATGGSADGMGLIQAEMTRAHQHVMSWGESYSGNFGNSALDRNRVGSAADDYDNTAYLTNDGAAYIDGQTWVGGENRPANLSVNFFIKY